jgi:hypothetical protein
VGCQGLGLQKTERIMAVHTRTKTCEGFPLRALCKKKWQASRAQEKSVKTSDRPDYRTLSPEENTSSIWEWWTVTLVEGATIKKNEPCMSCVNVRA